MDSPEPSGAAALTAAGTGLGYAALLALILVALFVLPALAFGALGVAG